jgi:hypothetical protein
LGDRGYFRQVLRAGVRLDNCELDNRLDKIANWVIKDVTSEPPQRIGSIASRSFTLAPGFGLLKL